MIHYHNGNEVNIDDKKGLISKNALTICLKLLFWHSIGKIWGNLNVIMISVIL